MVIAELPQCSVFVRFREKAGEWWGIFALLVSAWTGWLDEKSGEAVEKRENCKFGIFWAKMWILDKCCKNGTFWELAEVFTGVVLESA